MSYEEQHFALGEANEPLSLYIRNIENLPREFSFSDFFDNKLLIIKAIHRGLSYKVFDQIKKFTPFSEIDWADYLDLSQKTLQRYRDENDFYFKSIHSEKILELAEVTNFGIAVFGSSEKFYSWINSASFALGGLKPADLLRNSYGKEMVMGELGRIEHGIFA